MAKYSGWLTTSTTAFSPAVPAATEGISIPSNEYPIQFELSKNGANAYWHYTAPSGSGSTHTFGFYLCNYDQSKKCKLFTLTLSGSAGSVISQAFSNTLVTIDAWMLEGVTLPRIVAIAETSNENARMLTLEGSIVTSIWTGTLTNKSITAGASTGGSLAVSTTSAKAGTEITLTPTAYTGYQLSSYTISPALTITNNKFTMPNQNVTVTANFTKISYSVTVSAGTGGSLTASKSTANYGDVITLTPNAATGYQFSSYTKNPSGLSISNNKFTMPAQNVSITANFTKQSYAITKAASPSGAGTVSTKKSGTEVSVANYGDTIAISQTPASGYYFNGWTLNPSRTISSNSFTMPASAITVTANYLKYSTATLNKTTLEGGGTATLTISPNSSSFSHKYKLSFGSGMETDWVSVAAGTTSVSVSIPLNWSASIPNATSKTGGTMQVQTYSGSTLIGTHTISNLTYTVPASVKPSVGTITTSIVRTVGGVTYANIGNYYVQNHSAVRTQVSGSGAQSSTISSMSLTISGYSGSNYSKTVSAGSIDFTSGLLSIAGTATITVTATDSRGRTASKTATITVQAYTKPAGSLRLWRVNSGGTADDMGIYGKYTLSKQYTQLGSNTLTWTLSYSGGSQSGVADTGDIFPSSRKTFSETSDYTFTLTLTDSLETTVITATLSSARFIIAVDSTGNRIGFMRFPNKTIPSGKARTLEISADTQVYIGDVTLEDYIRSIT